MTIPATPAAPPAKPKTSVLNMTLWGSSIKRSELMHLSRQLGAFVEAGVPLIDAVRILGEEARNSTLRSTMVDIEDRLRRGERFSDTLNAHPKAFPEYYRAIVRSAELTGRLDVVLDQLARYIERDLEARRKISSALIYPAVIFVMSIFTIVILAGFVLPKFKNFFTSLNATLPLPTRILLAITDFLANWWWALVGGLVALVVAWLAATATEGGKRVRDRLLLGIPVIGHTVRVALIERFCRVMASMAAAGVNLPDALRVSTQSLRNRVFMGSLDRVGEAMMRGEGLAIPLGREKIFPSVATRMIRVGEDTGTLDHQLEITAKFYEGELDHRIKRLTALFEPAMIVGMGSLVGFVAIAMVSAMYGIFNQVTV
jgi:type IV pilus assembly protein PilC